MATTASAPSSASGAGSIDPALLPAVRSAQGALIASIFSHPAFDKEGERRYGKLFYVFETTIANNEALEVAHLGEDTENATKAALQECAENNALVAEDGTEGNDKMLEAARTRYADKAKGGESIDDVHLGEDIFGRAREARVAAERALGKVEEGGDL